MFLFGLRPLTNQINCNSLVLHLHKMKLARKELRESRNNLRVQFKAKLMDPSVKEKAWLLNEAVELVAIFAASVKPAERNRDKKK